MRIVKSKAFIGILCIVVALVFGLVGIPALNHIENRTVPVVRATAEIRQGTKITEDMLEVVQLSSKNLQPDIVSKKSAVIGTYAAVDIQNHDNITGAKFSASQQVYNLSDGQMLLSVTIKNFADGLSGKLQSGDIVTVFVPKASNTQQSGNNALLTSNSSSATAKADNPAELQYVKVAAVTASNGTDTDKTQLNGSSSQSSAQPATVTLLVNKQQAAALSALNQNELQFALVSRGDSKKTQALLDKQNAVLSQEAQ